MGVPAPHLHPLSLQTVCLSSQLLRPASTAVLNVPVDLYYLVRVNDPSQGSAVGSRFKCVEEQGEVEDLSEGEVDEGRSAKFVPSDLEAIRRRFEKDVSDSRDDKRREQRDARCEM